MLFAGRVREISCYFVWWLKQLLELLGVNVVEQSKYELQEKEYYLAKLKYEVRKEDNTSLLKLQDNC